MRAIFLLDIDVWNYSLVYHFWDSTEECVVFQISLAAMVAVNPRVHCLQEPVWSWGHQGQGGTRSV